MEQAPSVASFLAQPINRWVIAGSTVAWCKSQSLGGAVAWGRPTASDTREMLSAFEAVFQRDLGQKVDVVLDGRAIDSVDPEALSVLLTWLGERHDEILNRVRLQIGVIPDGVLGITLAGILPALGSTHHPFKVERDSLSALRAVAPDEAEALSEELAEALAKATGVPPLIRRLRDLMRERPSDLVVDAAARALGLSTRTLQRSLQTSGTSFQAELREARIVRAAALLGSTDEKIAVIASRVGVNESTLAELIRERFGMTPAEYRRSKGKT